MNFKSSSMNWIGNIRQTLETVCIEVEDKLCKEAKFVESRVQTVGVNVNKFIAEVMQDLLHSSSVAPAQERVCESSVVKDANAINEALIEKEPSDKEPEVTTLGKDSCRLLNSSEESVCREVDGLLPPSPGITVRGGGLITPLGKCIAFKTSEPTTNEDFVNNEGVRDEATLSSSPQNTTLLESGAACNPDKGVNPNLSVNEDNDMLECKKFTERPEEITEKVKPAPDASVLSTQPLSSELNEMDHEKQCVVPLIGKIPLTDSVNASEYASSSHSEDNIANAPDSVFDCSSSFSSYEVDPPTVADGVMVPVLPSSGSILPRESTDDNVKLEDSCIVVDNKPSFVPIQAGPHRSLKKMLKRALVSRMGSRKQREYEQLAILYGDIDAEAGTSSVPAKELQLKKLSDQDLSESDWEFV